MGLQETLQNMVNKDYDDLLSVAKSAIGDVLPYCQKVDSDNNGVIMLVSVLMAAVAADGVLSGLEKKFIKDLTGLEEDTVLSLASTSPEKNANLVDRFADALDAEGKAAVCVLVSAIMACDEKISREETKLLLKIIE